jgi:hypothetical protein
MLVYPNPASVNTKVKFYANDINTEVNIYSITGELVYSNNDTRVVGKMNEIDVNVYDFKQGIYFVKIGTLSKKLVIE